MKKNIVYYNFSGNRDNYEKKRTLNCVNKPLHIVYVFCDSHQTGLRFFAEIQPDSEIALLGHLQRGFYKTDLSSIRSVEWSEEYDNIPNKSYKIKSYQGDITITTIMVTPEKIEELLEHIETFADNFKIGDSSIIFLNVGQSYEYKTSDLPFENANNGFKYNLNSFEGIKMNPNDNNDNFEKIKKM